ncbi:hypothetical protein HMPREF1985_00046 [Mitsuokella sp. oral taxon 131 str. W9106]|nr:hypothetical protein HMPREF1985_00046 [Mitsuokella sp. oral taxon 131 str. W9106]
MRESKGHKASAYISEDVGMVFIASVMKHPQEKRGAYAFS